MDELLPRWFSDNYHLTFQLLRTNAYSSFLTIKTFLTAALGDIACSEEERQEAPVKHVKVKVADKGQNGGYQYVSIQLFVAMRDGTLFRLDKSCKVKLRPKLDRD